MVRFKLEAPRTKTFEKDYNNSEVFLTKEDGKGKIDVKIKKNEEAVKRVKEFYKENDLDMKERPNILMIFVDALSR